MSTLFQIGEVAVEIQRKSVRTLRLTVSPPDGRVRVTAPLRMPAATIEEFVLARQLWIRKHQARIAALPQPARLAYTSGETHYFQGRPYELRVLPTTSRSRVELDEQYLLLYVPEGSSSAEREIALAAWYRSQLKAQIPALLAYWQPVVGAQAQAWGVKQMRTRWGTCNVRARRIWLNLELIKKPTACLEYVVVHELTHLHERLHNARFWGLMDQFMPDWRQHKATLNQRVAGMQQPAGGDAD
ncbi:M48 family metallopeptidase [Hymenobacter busanensis]|uniref:M48 family metallopeptidase n=1 Tax=Hymenobacter busanensis TaxID=2607656 RepID=A0A7L4ZU59_9BACT|nr:SprT family zinc-dependent metalloprotease [Hymenobacter busanensis]KAA9339557.1 M48 family metallopeptidase [Hymenobacter busanensis]QHJ06688.1 DUF45 domain-containing protein [Hymenobacter busanensis]